MLGVISVGGLLLAKIPLETRQERNNYFTDRSQTMQQAIDNDLMKESDDRSPIERREDHLALLLVAVKDKWGYRCLLNFHN